MRVGWEDITRQIQQYLATEPDLHRKIPLPPPRGVITVEEIFLHLVAEEMIHFGEILAMSRQLGIDLPAPFLLDVRASSKPGHADLDGSA